MKKAVFSIFRISISALLILILFYIMRDKYDEILRVIKGTRIYILSLSLLVFISAISVASLRLKLIVEAQDLPIRFFEALSLTFIGYFFNNFLPTTIGGDVVKAYYLSKKTNETVGSFTSVFVDRIIGLITMIFMAFCALIFVGDRVIDIRVRHLIYAITILSILAVLFMVNKNFARVFSVLLRFLKPIEEKLKKVYMQIHRYRAHNTLIFQSLLISIVSQVLFFFSFGILALSIGSRISIIDILLRMPIIGVLSLLPSINGLGLREGSTVVLFGPMIGKENAFAISILWLLVLFLISLVGGLIYSLSPQFKVRLNEVKGSFAR